MGKDDDNESLCNLLKPALQNKDYSMSPDNLNTNQEMY